MAFMIYEIPGFLRIYKQNNYKFKLIPVNTDLEFQFFCGSKENDVTDLCRIV